MNLTSLKSQVETPSRPRQALLGALLRWAVWAASVAGAVVGAGGARGDPAPGDASRSGAATSLYTPGELADPLLPLSLEPLWPGRPASPRAPERTPPLGPPAVPGAETLPTPGGASPAPEVGVPGGGAAETTEAGAGAGAVADTVKVLVVRCRQLLVVHPVEAARLASLLRAGTSLERARQAVAGVEFTERSRVYLVDELDPAVREEVESLPTGAWSEPRPWRGRTLLFQVVEKGLRPRSAVPKLGQGLAPEELNRVARMMPERVAPRIASRDSADFTPASVAIQAKPEYPREATKAGEVTLQVTVGRVGEVVEVRKSTASDPIFEEPAIEAARRSTYRPAKRDGLAEQGTVTLTFQFTPPNPDLH